MNYYRRGIRPLKEKKYESQCYRIQFSGHRWNLAHVRSFQLNSMLEVLCCREKGSLCNPEGDSSIDIKKKKKLSVGLAHKPPYV